MNDDFSKWGDLSWEGEVAAPEGAVVFGSREEALASLGNFVVFEGVDCGCEMPFREAFVGLEPCMCCAGAVRGCLGGVDLAGVDALVVAPVDGGGGRRVLAPGVFRGLRERCDEMGVMLVSDESSVPAGVCGREYAYGYCGAVPNGVLVRLGGGGKVALVDADGDGAGLTGAAEEGFALKLQLERLISPNRGRVRGVGLLQGLALHADDGKPDPVRAARVGDALGLPCEGHVLLLCPEPGTVDAAGAKALRVAIDAELAVSR